MEDDEEDHRPTTAMTAASADSSPFDEKTIADTRLGPGQDVGGYIIDGEIGKGGMGFVYSATHPIIGKRAAIKVLKPEVSKQPIVVERFIQEARAVNQIGHPNIIDIFAFGQLPDGRAYHVMDLLEGESLRKRIKRGTIHPSEVAAIIGDVASALTAAHEKGFVHRDLKPDNIFLVHRAEGWPDVKLLDFGLAKLMPEVGVAPFTTKTGVMLGTPEYMSPEQARGQGVDYRTDIYALGILTFELLARQRPFPSLGDAFATLQAHLEELPPSLAHLVPGLPEELVQLVEAMLAKDPAARPSLAAVRNVLKRLRTTALPSRTEASFGDAPRPAAPPLRTSGLVPNPPPANPNVDDDAVHTREHRRPNTPPTFVEGPEALPPTAPRRTLSHPPVAVPSYQSMHVQVAPARDSAPSVPSYQSMHVQSTPSLQPASGIGGTRLGVEPARASTLQPAPQRVNHVWLVVGALVAIALGIAIALVAMS